MAAEQPITTSKQCAWCGENGPWRLYGRRRTDLQTGALRDNATIRTVVLMNETLFFCSESHRETYYFGM